MGKQRGLTAFLYFELLALSFKGADMRAFRMMILASAALWAAPAYADAILLDGNESGSGCQINCSVIGVALGTDINLDLIVNTSNYRPNGTLTTADIEGYNLTLGSLHISNLTNPDISFSAVVPPNGDWSGYWDSYHDWYFSVSVPSSSETISVGPLGWTVSKTSGQYAASLPAENITMTKRTLADVVRGAVSVTYSGDEVDAVFRPNYGLTLDQAAMLGGFDHFNWLQVAEVYPGALVATAVSGCWTPNAPISAPFVDPIIGGMQGFPADSYAPYWDEGPQLCPFQKSGYSIDDPANTTAYNLFFRDRPGDAFLLPSEYMRFKTSLIGVDANGNIASSPLDTFDWKSNYQPLTGNGAASAARNIDPWPDGGTGGIIDATMLDDPLDVSDDVKQAWLSAGVPLTDAPEPLTLSIFAAGLLGLSLTRRKPKVFNAILLGRHS